MAEYLPQNGSEIDIECKHPLFDIYHELRLPYKRLCALSRPLAERFLSDIVESGDYASGSALAASLENEFLGSFFYDRDLLEYAVKLLDGEAWQAVSALIYYVEELGESIDFDRLFQYLRLNFNLDFCSEVLDNNTDLIGKAEIGRVKSPSVKSVDQLSFLRDSWLGRFYLLRLKRYSLVRTCTIWLWRNGYPLYARYIFPAINRRKTGSWKPLLNINDYVFKLGSSCKYSIQDPMSFETPAPLVFPAARQNELSSPHDRFVFPEIFVAKIVDGTIWGGSNLVHTDSSIVHHSLYDFARDYTSEELHGRVSIDPKRGRGRCLQIDENHLELDVAAAFVDACAPNYAHWLTEVLPRVVIFCGQECYKDIPIIVNDGLHRNLIESLLLVVGTNRKILTLPIGNSVKVKELYFTSVAGYVPFERRNVRISGHSHGIFSPFAFREMQEKLIGAVKGRGEEKKWPKKIYLRRNSGVRKVLNSAEVEKVLLERGFSIVEPEKLSFSQQVSLFSQVEIVVASTGAAVANIVFCPPKTKIVVFIASYPDTSYWYWQNIALASENVVRYVFGDIAPEAKKSIHSDFFVDIQSVIDAL